MFKFFISLFFIALALFLTSKISYQEGLNYARAEAYYTSHPEVLINANKGRACQVSPKLKPFANWEELYQYELSIEP